MEDRDTILDFWFGRDPDDAAVARERSSLWWEKNPETDREIRRRFEPLVLAAEAGELDEWRSSSDGTLALILLMDQFPRNIYRSTPAAFRFDELALGLCRNGLGEGADKKLRPIERVFFYLPLEHSEDLDDQHRCVTLFRELAGEVEAQLKPTFEEYLDYAVRHRDIVRRFGRFEIRAA